MNIEQLVAELRTIPDGAQFSEHSFGLLHHAAFGVLPMLFPLHRTFAELGYTHEELAQQIIQRHVNNVTAALTQ